MDAIDLHPLVEDLSSNIDDLEESLAPLLKSAISRSTSKLPLLDKAKVYVLVTYAIESILFSCLRLNGVDAKSHPVFQELARAKEYFAKIKTAETAGAKRTSTLDKEAANRFIKHGLAGNERFDREREERLAREKAGAKRKFDGIQVGMHTRFDGAAKKMRTAEDATARGDVALPQGGTGASTVTSDVEMLPKELSDRDAKAEKKAAKRQRRLERRLAESGGSALSSDGVEPDGPSPRRVRSNGADAEEDNEAQKPSRSTAEALESSLQSSSPVGEETSRQKKTKKKKRSKLQKLEDERADEMK